MKKTQTTFILVLAACCALFFTNLGGRDFWAPDEGDFAQIVKELDNDLVVPHLNGEAYGEKPPLFYYAVFACAKLFRWLPDEASMRLASSFAAIAVIVVFFLTLKARFGLTRTLHATAILGLTPLFYWQARYLQVDMVFSAALVVALLFFFTFMETERKASYYLFFICLALAFMTKGHSQRGARRARHHLYCASEKMGHRQPALPASASSLFIAIVLPWYLPCMPARVFPTSTNILRQNFCGSSAPGATRGPFTTILQRSPGFFPFSLFLPLGLYAAVRNWKTDRSTRFFTLWFVWFFFFLSLSSGKISKYMLPALPALAVIVSGNDHRHESIYNRIAFGVTAGVFAALGMGLIVYRTSLYGEFLPERVILGSLAICAGFLVFLSMRHHRARAAFVSIAAFMALAYMTGNISIFEKWNRYKSPKPMAQKIRALAGDTVPWVYYGSMRGVYVYYVGRLAVHVEEHDVAGLKDLASRRREFYILTRGRDADEVTGALPGAVVETEDRIGDTAMVLFKFTREDGG